MKRLGRPPHVDIAYFSTRIAMGALPHEAALSAGCRAHGISALGKVGRALLRTPEVHALVEIARSPACQVRLEDFPVKTPRE